MIVQRRDILEQARRTKAPARACWDSEQEARVSKAFDFSFHVRGETEIFEEPNLIIAGRQDNMSGYLDAIDLMPQFPRASLAVLDAAGHGLAWERSEVFNALITDWPVDNRLARANECRLSITFGCIPFYIQRLAG